MAEMTDDLDALGEAVRAATEALAAMGRGVESAGEGSRKAAEEAGGGLASAFGSLKAGVMSAYGELAALPDKMRPFVEALNPAVLETFDQAMRSVQATIGQAFEGVFPILAEFARQVADVIAPLFEQLRPIMDQLTRDVASKLLPVFQLLTEVLVALIPAFAIVNELLKPLMAVLPLWAHYMRLIVAVWVGLFATLGGSMAPLKDVMDDMVKAMRNAVRWLIVFAAQLALFLGLKKVYESIQKAFEPRKEGARKIGAAEAGGISDMASILKEATAGAYTATGTQADETIEDLMKGISEEIKKAGARQEEFAANFTKIITDILNTAFPGLRLDVEKVREIAQFFRDRVKDAAAGRSMLPAGVQTDRNRLVAVIGGPGTVQLLRNMGLIE